MTPRILLLLSTTTYKARAFIAAANKLGLEVVIGSDRTQALAALHPAGHLTLPFHDPVRAASRVLEFARTRPLHAIVAADDDGALVAAHATEGLAQGSDPLGRNPVAAIRAALDKSLTRAALARAGLPVPRVWQFTVRDAPAPVAARVEYPCVLKPVGLSASRGIMRADNSDQFVERFQRLRALMERADVRTQLARTAPFDVHGGAPVLAEAFIPGSEIAAEGLLHRGRLHLLALFDKPDALDGPFFQETLYVTPSRHAPELQAAIERALQQACAALGLVDGPVHAEARCNDRGVWVLEVAPRSIGGLCARALRFGPLGDVSLEEMILRAAVGEAPDALAREPVASGVMMIPIPKSGMLREVRGAAAAASVRHVVGIDLTLPAGQFVEPPPEGGRYLGFIFARATTPQTVEAALRQSFAVLDIDIDDTNGGIMPQTVPNAGAS